MDTSLSRLRTICESVSSLVTDFRDAGYELYLVGGVVRDVLLDEAEIQDIDLTTDARPDQIREVIAPIAESIWAQGERFGTLGAKIGGIDVEITTYRNETYSADSRKPEVSFGDTITEDLKRRDFTINAMAFDCIQGVIVDPFHGAQDLSDRVLRTPGDPETSFSDDPLRVLRAGRFAARLNLGFDSKLVEAARTQSDRISVVSAERITVELDKLLAADHLEVGFGFLGSAAFFETYLTWLADSAVRDLFLSDAASSTDVDLRRTLLFRRSPDSKLEMEKLKYSRSSINHVASTVRAVSDLQSDDDVKYVLRKLIHKQTAEVVSGAVQCKAIDGDSEILNIYEDLVATESAQLELPLSGDEIMKRLGLETGPAVGSSLEKVAELMYRTGPITSEDAWKLLEQ